MRLRVRIETPLSSRVREPTVVRPSTCVLERSARAEPPVVSERDVAAAPDDSDFALWAVAPRSPRLWPPAFWRCRLEPESDPALMDEPPDAFDPAEPAEGLVCANAVVLISA